MSLKENVKIVAGDQRETRQVGGRTDGDAPRVITRPDRWTRVRPSRQALFALALAATCGLTACGRGASGSPPPGPAPVTFAWTPVPTASRLYYDNSGGIRDSLRVVVRDAGTLGVVWSQATSGQSSPPPAPSVDFNREMLLLVAAGRKTAEEQIRVDSVAVQRAGGEETLFAVVRLTEGCGRFNIDAWPLEVVRVNRFDGPVEFVERRTRAADC